MHRIYVYGTLRPGTGEAIEVPGQMFDLGWFPGAVLIGVEPKHRILVEAIDVDDLGLERLDQYEGYDSKNPEHSLYIRKEFKDGFIYQYNGSVDGKTPVPPNSAGVCDWLEYTQMKESCNAGIYSRREVLRD